MIYSKDTFAFTASTNVVAMDEEVALRWLAESRMIAEFSVPEATQAAEVTGLDSL